MKHIALIGVAVALIAVAKTTSANAGAVTRVPAQRTMSISDGYVFLDQMQDLYATGSVPRLVQSFAGGVLGKQHFTDSETYDDAVIIDAYLAEKTSASLSRAETIGNALVYVQTHDRADDGRIRAAYAPTPLARPSDVRATDRASDVGNMAWVGQALVHLYAASRDAKYLAAAEAIGNWVQAHCYDARGSGGYTGGLTAGGTHIKWKSTEHNLDLYSLFTLLAEATGAPVWSARSAMAKGFVEAMWYPHDGRFYVGTTSNGRTPNTTALPEDVNSWSYLAFGNSAYAASIDWDVRNLSVSAGGFSGASFCEGDRTGVWFEGTAHLADALEFRSGRGDQSQADSYLSDIEFAQTNGLNNDGLGIIAASKNKLSDCEGEFYYASLHTGATSWYLLAAEHVDPFLPIPASLARE